MAENAPLERWSTGLDDAQLAAVTHPGNPLCILAGAGSGKTRVLTRRIARRVADGDADVRHVLVLTFTSRAANELRGRLTELVGRDLPTAGTFHAIAYQQLRSWWQEQHRAEPALLDRKSRLVSRLLPAQFPLRPATVVSELDWAQARTVGPDDYVAEVRRTGRTVPIDPERIAEVYAAYVAEKRHRRVVDFDDLLSECADAFRSDAAFARAQRWRFRHVFVDEYQDVNPLQQRLLDAWVDGRDDLCVVGDPNQAIYRWNGADASFLRDFPTSHPGATVLELTTNHRSSPVVVALAEAVLAAAPDGRPGEPAAPPHDHGVPPAITACRDSESEAVTVARHLRDARRPGAPWAHQAVLVRTNAQAASIAELLERAGIPSRLRATRSLLEEPSVRDALRSAGRSTGSLVNWTEELEDRAGDDEHLVELVAYGRRLLAEQPTAPAAALPGWVTATARGDESARVRADGVDVVSFHAAKGLEWPIVHLAGLEEGYVPSSRARDAEALAEERRLLYVAVSRAGQTVSCTWARRRTFGSRTVQRQPSRWLAALQQVVDLATPGTRDPDPAVARRALAEVRLALPIADAAAPTDSAAAASRLERWRASVARAAAIPPSVVLPDSVLARIVERAPTEVEDLRSIEGLGVSSIDHHGEAILRALAAEQVVAR